MALISQMYNIGGGSGGYNASLPTPPKKSVIRNTSEATATLAFTGQNAGKNGMFSYSYYQWDIRSAVANCRFGISNNTNWSSSSVMALRNDSIGATVWTKAYSTLGTSGPQSACFDITGGYYYVFTTTATELRLWRIRLSDGVATQVAVDTGTKCPSYPYGTTEPRGMIARFIATGVIEFIYYATASTCYRTTVNVSTGVFTTATSFNPVGYLAPSEIWSIPSSSGYVAPTAQYITMDGKISICFTPTQLLDVPVAATGTDGGNRGSIRHYIITRGLGRCTVGIVDPGYNTPYRHDPAVLSGSYQEQFMATDNKGTVAMLTALTQYVPGWDGRFEFYDAADFDRWLTEIADEAGLPAGGFW